MRKFYFAFCMIVYTLFGVTAANAQLTGIKTIPVNCATITDAITDLNAQGVGAGGVTFNIAAGYTETLTAKLTLTATGTSANPIVFQKSGAGANPILTAYTGINAAGSSIGDGFWVLAGSDHITIDGIDLQENAANSTPTMQMEFGYAMFKASATDGCQFNTIKNCVITLDRSSFAVWTPAATSNGSTGIVIGNCLNTATPVVTITDAGGSNSFNKVYANTIQNCQTGVALWGFAAISGGGPSPDPSTFLGDIGNDIGGNTAATGNTILNYGGATGANRPAIAVSGTTQWSFNCSYNTINNNNGAGINHPNILRAFIFDGTVAGQSTTCNNNNITLHAATTGTNNLVFIENSAGTAAGIGAGGILTINNNSIGGDHNTANGSGVLTAILNSGQFTTVNINANIIDGVSYGAAGLTNSGVVTVISHTAAANTVNIQNNTIKNINRTGNGGTALLVGINVTAGTNQYLVSDTIELMSINGTTGAGSSIQAINISGGSSLVDNNTIRNITCNKTTGTGAISAIFQSTASTADVFTNNKIYNFTHLGSGAIAGMNWASNTAQKTVSGNEIYSFNTAAGTSVLGIFQGSATTSDIFKNKIYDLSTGNSNNAIPFPIVSGMTISNLSSAGTTVYNNFIADIKAPNSNVTVNTSGAPSVRGINVLASNASSYIRIYYNTIYLNATSAAANFGSAGLFTGASADATAAAVTLKNNIIINRSVHNGNGLSVAYQRAGTPLASIAASDNNLFYAGTPGAANLIFFDATNSEQTLAAFQTRVNPHDGSSKTEDVVFRSTAGSSPDFLKFSTAVPSLVESGGVSLSGIVDNDHQNNIRQGSGGYAGTGIAPDMGAWELNGVKAQYWFRSIANGDWNQPSSWENSTNAGALWTPATAFPTSLAEKTFIRNGFTTTLTANAATYTMEMSTTGMIELGASDLVVASNITGAGNTSYVKTNGTGALTINNVDATGNTFPVGNSTYNPLVFTNGSDKNWTVRVEDALNNVLSPFSTDRAIDRTWHIAPSSPVTTGPNITFNFNDNIASGQLVNPAIYNADADRNVVFWHYDGSTWVAASAPTAMTAIPGAQAITLNGYTSFSPFAISKSSGLLPINLTNLKAAEQSTGIRINWSNMTETAIQNYIVEHAVEQGSFKVIGTVNARSNNGGKEDYQFFHINPANAVNYYRIRSVELNIVISQ